MLNRASSEWWSRRGRFCVPAAQSADALEKISAGSKEEGSRETGSDSVLADSFGIPPPSNTHTLLPQKPEVAVVTGSGASWRLLLQSVLKKKKWRIRRLLVCYRSSATFRKSLDDSVDLVFLFPSGWSLSSFFCRNSEGNYHNSIFMLCVNWAISWPK